MNDFDYRHWLSLARKYSRKREEAEDLLHDALLVALETGRLDFSKESNRRWFTGVLKNQGAMAARSAERRKRREASWRGSGDPPVPDYQKPSAALLAQLTPAGRIVMALALLGLDRDEIRTVLDISSAALRQRLTTIRKALGQLPDHLQSEALALAYQRKRNSDDAAFGLIRRALLARLRQTPGIGTHDPDGHLFVVDLP